MEKTISYFDGVHIVFSTLLKNYNTNIKNLQEFHQK